MWEIVRNQNPLMMPPTATVKAACGRMRDRRVGAVLVVDPSCHLLGIFTGRDAIARVLAEGRSPSTRLKDVMTPVPDTITPERTAIDALRLMEEGGFRHVPIVDGGRAVGIVSRGDFRGTEQGQLDDEAALRERIW